MRAIEIAAQVATELGKGWTAEPGQWDMSGPSDAYLNGLGGEQVHVMVNGYGNRGRIELRMSLDHDAYKHYSNHLDGQIPEITVAESRPPAQIAREIERRLLPKLRAVLASVTERKRNHDDAEARRNARIAELIELLGATTEHLTRNGLDEVRAGRFGDTVDATVKVGYGARDVTFEIRTSSREAADMIAVAIATARTLETGGEQ